MKFGLLPTLRVTRVTDQSGQDLHFIQENRKEDGSFYAILNEAPAMGQEHAITMEYVGDKVLANAGNGSYYVGARQSWYPNLNGFGEKALYDLTFKVPPSNVVISVGKLRRTIHGSRICGDALGDAGAGGRGGLQLRPIQKNRLPRQRHALRTFRILPDGAAEQPAAVLAQRILERHGSDAR